MYKNSIRVPSKRGSSERDIDNMVFFMFILLACMALATSTLATIFYRDDEARARLWYLSIRRGGKTQAQYNGGAVTFFFTFLNSLVLYGYLVPIALYVTLEIVRVSVGLIMARDLAMYHAATDKPLAVRTTNLNEEIGVVQVVLSDKTGTLTQNQMDFFKCSISGIAYGAGVTEVERAVLENKKKSRANGAKKSGRDARPSAIEGATEDPGKPPRGGVRVDVEGAILLDELEMDPEVEAKLESIRCKGFNFWDERLMEGNWERQPNREDIEMFLRCIAVCHTVIPDVNPETGEVLFEAESPDEVRRWVMG